MAKRLSTMYDMRVYTISGKEVGSVKDFIVDLEEGRISRFTLEPIMTVSKEDAVRILREKSIFYENVVSVSDIILISPKKENA